MVTRATATVTITIDAHSEAVAALDAARRDEKRLSVELARTAKGKTGPVTRKLNAARAEGEAQQAIIDSGKWHVRVRTLGAGAYRNLLKNHPPKDGDELEQKLGYNADTFGAALIRATTVNAVDHAGELVDLDLDALLDDDDGVSPYDFEQWFRTALALQTQGGTRVPLLRAS